MNEAIFLSHIVFVGGSLLFFLKKGKHALMAATAFLAVLANVFVVKQIQLFGLNVTCTDALTVGSMLGIGLLQEFYGKAIAKKAVRLAFFLLFFFGAVSQIHLLYLPSSVDTAQGALQKIFGMTPRIVAASFFAFYLMQKCNIFCMHFLKNHFKHWHLSVRLAIAGLLSQIVDTSLFSFLGLYGIVHSLLHIFIMSLALKVFILCIGTSILSLCKRFAPKEVHGSFSV